MEKFFMRTIQKFRAFRSQKLDPVGKVFVKLHVSPNLLTVFSLLWGLLCVYYLFSEYVLFVFFGALHLFFDGMDGVVARLTRSSTFGQYFDIGVDSLISILFVLKVGWYLSEIYPLLIAGLFTLAVLVHLISKLRAPVVFIRTVSFIVLVIATFPFFLWTKHLLILGYVVVGFLTVYSLMKQIQYKIQS